MSRKISQIIYNDLTGGINNVDSKETINTTSKKTQTPEMVNVEYFKLGGIKSMEGNQLINPTVTRQVDELGNDLAIVGGWEYIKGSNRYMVIGLSNGEVKVYDDTAGDNGDFVSIYKFATPTQRMSFCNMNDGVVITNGADDPIFYEKNRRQIISGTVDITQDSPNVTGTLTYFTIELKPGDTVEIDDNVYRVEEVVDDTNLILSTDALTTADDVPIYLSEVSECNASLTNSDPEEPEGFVPVPIRGLAIQYYNGRLWIGTDNGLFYSQVGQYNKWDIYYDAGAIYSIYNDTSKITALGLFSEYLMVHKELNTYILTMDGTGETISIKPFSNITCDSQQSWIVSNTKYFVYSREYMDIYPLVQHTVFNDKFLGEPITQKVRNIFHSVRQADSDKIFCVSRPKARQMIFYLPTVDVYGSGFALIYDFQTKSWLARKVPNNVTCAFNYMNNIYIGTADGLVLKEFTSPTFKVLNNNKEVIDAPINATYKSPWFSWLEGYTQSFAEFMIEIANDYRNEFIIRTWKDGQSRTEDRLISSDALDGKALVWEGIYDDYDNDTTWDNDNWVRGTFETIRMLLPNNVYEDFQLEISTPNLGQSFAIYEYAFRRLEHEEEPW